ncbi:SLC13 family permease [Nocardia donostiensis]|uniref:Transporter n=1 Tax=Nocardia donostiensis TaxID=1538463 RepID=A0A1W0BAH9_9NOCA|nr:SLC13 family permease [Nocardia donostiensis]ONM50052.1 transporter [Nocardia donostiensis]OQS15714.1 transporter [Nocardia donostiensis]OQS19418.1 transporter [Nocardia donostiensis]
MSVTEFRTVAPRPRRVPPSSPRPALPGLSRPAAAAAAVGTLLCAGIVAAAAFGDLERDGAVTLVVFVAAIWMWVFAPLPDTYIALGAALVLVVAGPIDTDTFTGTLGDSVIWLLVGAFIIAAAVTASGLSARVAARLLTLARTPRQLVHLITVALLVTAFAIPATSGRAALALPVFLALAGVLRDRPRLVLALAVVFPSVILFSAVGSLLGAGAHLIASEIVEAATGDGFGFLQWMMLGLPLAVIWSHLAAEMALAMFTDRAERGRRLSVPASAFATAGEQLTGPLSAPQKRVLVVLAAVVTLWCSEPWHGIDPAVVAMLGALVATAPRFGVTTLPAAAKTIPWTLLLFLAATLCLGIAVTTSGASVWLAELVFGPVGSLGSASGVVFLVVVVVVSLLLHLMIQSRSARSAVLVPIIVATAPAVGVDPMAAAFISTAAAGYCHTLTSSAKPVAMFAAADGVPGYRPEHLLRYSAAIAPVSVALLLAFTLWIWPFLGLPLSS